MGKDKHQNFFISMNEEAESRGIEYGFPAALIVEPSRITVSGRAIQTYCESVGVDVTAPKSTAEELSNSESANTEVEEPEWVFQNSWENRRPWKGTLGEVLVFRNSKTGKYIKEYRSYGRNAVSKRIHFATKSADDTQAYGILSAERKANSVLKKLLTKQQWISYRLSGTFWEKSKRSGVKYFIRRGRPALVFREVSKEVQEQLGVFLEGLCAMCLHPLGYHNNSFAGLMTPTDEVINFVILIRVNEPYLWRKSIQHRFTDLQSGV